MNRRDLIINILKCAFGLIRKRNLPIFDIYEEHLKNYTTTEIDIKKNLSRMPPLEYLN